MICVIVADDDALSMTHITMMETKKRKRTTSKGAAGDAYEGGDVGTQDQGAEDPIPLDSLASIRQLKNAMMKEKDAVRAYIVI